MEITPKIIIDVSSLIASDIGESEKHDINENISHVDEIKILKPIIGEIKISNIGECLLAEINIKSAIKLDCSRCARDFAYNIDLNYKQSFKKNPGDDDFAITNDSKIDIWPSIRQEILINIPFQPLCSEKCKIAKSN